MKLKPYKEILKMAKEKLDEYQAPLRAARAKKQAELEICKIEEKMASQEAKISELCADKEINFDSIIKALDEMGLMERRKKQFEMIIKEMFPDVK